MEASKREGELRVEVESRGGEAPHGGRELGGEGELEAKLRLTRGALGSDLGENSAAGDAAVKASVEDPATGGELLGRKWTDKEGFGIHFLGLVPMWKVRRRQRK